MLTRRRLAGVLAASALTPGLLAHAARAQAWPSRAVRVICPVAPGGSIDAVTRLVAARLAEIWRQQVVVENRTGGSNNIAAAAIAQGVQVVGSSMSVSLSVDMQVALYSQWGIHCTAE